MMTAMNMTDMNTHTYYIVQSPNTKKQLINVKKSVHWLPVDIVTKKQVIGTWWISTFVKMSHQILILAMNIATYINWGTKFH